MRSGSKLRLAADLGRGGFQGRMGPLCRFSRSVEVGSEGQPAGEAVSPPWRGSIQKPRRCAGLGDLADLVQ